MTNRQRAMSIARRVDVVPSISELEIAEIIEAELDAATQAAEERMISAIKSAVGEELRRHFGASWKEYNVASRIIRAIEVGEK